MYCEFYGIQEKPFSITPDPKYLYLGKTHKEAFAHLIYGIRERGGFIVVTGEIGTGKTTLCRALLNHLDADTMVAFIFNPTLSARELLQCINEDFGIDSKGNTQKELIDELNRFLLEKRQAGKNTVLIIDEAQNLDMEVLEHIRLLSNLETDTEKLLQIILIGQPEFRQMLEQPQLLQLNQRVTVRYHLSPLTREETDAYVRHRLNVAGAEDKIDITPDALKKIHRYSKGVPRLINVICDRALLAGYSLRMRFIGGLIIDRAYREVSGVEKTDPVRRILQLLRHGILPGSVLALVLLVVALGVNFWVSGEKGKSPGKGGGKIVSNAATRTQRSVPEKGSAESKIQAQETSVLSPAVIARSTRVNEAAEDSARKSPTMIGTTDPEPTEPSRKSPKTSGKAGQAAGAISREPLTISGTAEGVPLDTVVNETTETLESPEPLTQELLAGAEQGSDTTEGVVRKKEPEEPEATFPVETVSEPSPEVSLTEEADVQWFRKELVLSLSEQTVRETRDRAFQAVVEDWSRQLPVRTLWAEAMVAPDLYKAAGLLGFRCYHLKEDFSRIRALNLPAILDLKMGDVLGKRYVAMLALDGTRAAISPALSDGTRFVPLSLLEEFWFGSAYILWKDWVGGTGILVQGMRGETVNWLQASLKELGYLALGPTGVFDMETAAAVRKFQQDNHLIVDGILGPQTKICLFHALGHFKMPSLEASGKTKEVPGP